MANLIPPPLSLYIHLPWCVKKCPYCDFNSHTHQGILQEKQYIDALLADLDQDLQQIQPRPIHSIFIGGGTPSLFSPDSLQRLLEGIHSRLTLSQEIEITLEANPGTAESTKFKQFAQLGINRLSLGIQSFQDDKLRSLGRIHNAEEAMSAAEMAQAAGFQSINLDLMFGLPHQSVKDALYDIETAIHLAPEHISHYQLTLEPNTLFAKQPPPLPPDDNIWHLQQQCQEKLAHHGYLRYEVSAFASPGNECQHNLNYWQFGDYLGIGAGAHGKYTQDNSIRRRWKIRHPQHYMDKSGGLGRVGGDIEVENTQRPLEFMMNTLRLRSGFTPEQYEQRTGLPWMPQKSVIDRLVADQLLQFKGGFVYCTDKGWNLLNTVLEAFA